MIRISKFWMWALLIAPLAALAIVVLGGCEEESQSQNVRWSNTSVPGVYGRATVDYSRYGNIRTVYFANTTDEFVTAFVYQAEYSGDVNLMSLVQSGLLVSTQIVFPRSNGSIDTAEPYYWTWIWRGKWRIDRELKEIVPLEERAASVTDVD